MEKEKLVALVTAAQKGDNQAITDLYEAFHQDLYYHIYKTVNDASLAEDLLQDTFIEICQTVEKLQEPAAFVTWSKQIAYHRCTAYFKKRREILADEDEEGYSVFDTIEEDRAEFIPDEALDKEDFKQTIQGIINDLPPEQRSAIMLRYFDEISVKEIAEIQGVTEGTVKSRLNYGRKSIKEAVEAYEKKSGVKLHCVGVIPLLLWLFRETRKSGAAAAAPVAASTVAAKAAGGVVAKKVVAGVVAAALVTGGVAVGITRLKKDKSPATPKETTAQTVAQTQSEETTPVVEEKIMDWLGYGNDGGINPRRFELHVDQMTDTQISGHLQVSHIYKPLHDTDFTGTGVEADGVITYTLKFSVPVTFGTIVTYTYEEMDILYNKETDQFIFDFQYEATMDRVSAEPSEVLWENVTFSGIGEDNFYVGFTNEGHTFRMDITQQRMDAISGTFTVSYEDKVDHETAFVGRGFREDNKIYYEISLETPRTETYILENTVDGFWLTYDLDTQTFTTEELVPMYDFQLTKNN